MGGCNLIDFEDEHEPVHMFDLDITKYAMCIVYVSMYCPIAHSPIKENLSQGV